VPLLLRAGYYPSALLYIVYGVVCVWGFAVWWRAQHAMRPADFDDERAVLRQLDSAAGRP
jgi:nicotinamide riboside transporter PnuC